MTLILSNDDVEKLLTMRDCIAVMEEAYAELAEGRGVSRTRSDCFTPTVRADALYSLKSMDGVAPKLGVGAVRINSDIVTWPKEGGNERRVKVPAAPNRRYTGLVLLFSSDPDVASDAVAEAFAQALRRGDALRDPERWVWKVAFRVAAAELKEGRRTGPRLRNVRIRSRRTRST